MRLCHIDRIDDPRLDQYRNVADGELLRRHGAFVAEGRLIVRRLIESGAPIFSLLLNEASYRALEPALAALSGAYAISLGSQHIEPLTATSAQNWSPLFRTRGYGYLDAKDPRTGVRAEDLKVVFAEDTRYHRLSVVDDADSRYLRFDNSLQSAMYIDDPLRTRFAYTDLFHLAKAYNPEARDIVFIGLGAGSSEKRMLQDFDDVRLHAVEIDPVVADVAHDWFELPRDDPRLQVSVGDGRRFLADDDARWDAIVIDAFFADAIPFHLVTQEFLRLAQSRLEPGGVVVTNAIGAIAGPGSRLFRSIFKTYATEFPSVAVHPVAEPGYSDDSLSNLMVVATDAALPSKQFLQERWNAIRERARTAPDLTKAIRNRREGAIPLRDVPVLTDDYAPTDALLLIE